MGKPIGFYVWRGHWLTLVQYPTGQLVVRGLSQSDVPRWRADVRTGKVKLSNP